MRRLSDKAISEFKRIYLKVKGVELSDFEAECMALELLELAALTLRDDDDIDEC